MDEHLAQAATGPDLRGERGVALLLGDETLRDEDVAERSVGARATGGDAVTPESLEEGHAELIERLATRPIETQLPDFLVRPEPSLPGSVSHRPRAWECREGGGRPEPLPRRPCTSVRPNGRKRTVARLVNEITTRATFRARNDTN